MSEGWWVASNYRNSIIRERKQEEMLVSMITARDQARGWKYIFIKDKTYYFIS